jgi:hypothetical protein
LNNAGDSSCALADADAAAESKTTMEHERRRKRLEGKKVKGVIADSIVNGNGRMSKGFSSVMPQRQRYCGCSGPDRNISTFR